MSDNELLLVAEEIMEMGKTSGKDAIVRLCHDYVTSLVASGKLGYTV